MFSIAVSVLGSSQCDDGRRRQKDWVSLLHHCVARATHVEDHEANFSPSKGPALEIPSKSDHSSLNPEFHQSTPDRLPNASVHHPYE